MVETSFNTDRTLLVLYGSETGTAQDYASEIGRSAQRLRFDTRVMAMNDLNLSLLPNMPVIIFVTSTTGQGDMPSNISTFWKFLLRKKLPQDLLSRLWFTSFGLGDSTYLKFNWAVKKLHKRILQLGGKELCARGEGDEQHSEGIDGAFIPWTKQLFEALLERWPLPEGVEKVPEEVALPREYVLEFDEAGMANKMNLDKVLDIHIPRHNSQLATLQRNVRVTSETHFQDVRHITFTTEKDVAYSPGDVLSLSPQNLPKDVSAFLTSQGWDSVADIPLEIYPTPYLASLSITSKLPVPHPPISDPVSPLTLRTLLTHHLDITAIPRRSFFAHIANYTKDPLHKERLLEFVDPEHLDELWDYTTRPRRTILEVLQEFNSVKLDWRDGLICCGGIGLIRERLFSIASSQRGHSIPTLASPSMDHTQINGNGTNLHASRKLSSRTVEILVAIVRYQTILKKPRTGLCTRWLTTLAPGAKVNIMITPNAAGTGFSPSSGLSGELQKPVVMIGPGTGVAPMRSLAWERLAIGKEESRRVGDMLLFFGCRNSHADFFFREEWERWQHRHENDLHKETNGEGRTQAGNCANEGCRRVYVAFSRDQEKKHYVQHLVREHAEEVFRLLHDQEGIVYVCGSSGRMPQAVREALVEIFENGGGNDRKLDRGAAERYLAGMERAGRYRQETW